MAKPTKVQINKLSRTSSLGDEDVMVIEQKTNDKYITRSTTLADLSDYFGAGGGGGGGGKVKAINVIYDNTTSGLVALDVQNAIDELNVKINEMATAGIRSAQIYIGSAEYTSEPMP